jgi:ribosomal-protein-alanine N-acetyltransferase
VPEPLVTARLKLVPFGLDLEDTVRGARIPEGWPDEELRGLLDSYLTWLRDDPGISGFGPWVALARDESVVVGSAGFLGRPNDAGEIELGYGIVDEFRNRGYATEAAAALVEWGLAQPGVRRVVARSAPDNVASTRVLEKTGFVRKGRAGELARWAVE